MSFSKLVTNIAILGLILAGGCGSDPPSKGQVVTGEVIVSGQPLKRGLIIFQPIEGTAGPAATADVVEGHFATTVQMGPWPGKFLVKIESIPPEIAAIAAGKSPHPGQLESSEPHREIDAQFNRKSQITIEVIAGENPPHTFDVRWQGS
ncbi:hypothetical protein [Blastopirellula marina]|uniref:Carboxypeptidase regulatory-like domain-containing protein n=1 Tax=Blastopirellula marina TaxID=124 RepID=A0A2S8FHU0_9BACT|nr:hypothetical protein [Blastopirellula marina]PQO31640.1 hypothetical protein C5Y98_19690 [Blastopirellula marina]PTL42947.1 hypothetical protein C5Y97_19700 [Blastopirellula marina]